MVVAGVIPIDRLVDVVSPVRVILSRIGMLQFRQAYGLSSLDIGRIGNISEVDAAQAIASLAQARGWTQAAGRPDQTRSGRQIIKDYTNGHLVHCESPPGHVPLHRPKDEDGVDLYKQVACSSCVEKSFRRSMENRRVFHLKKKTTGLVPRTSCYRNASRPKRRLERNRGGQHTNSTESLLGRRAIEAGSTTKMVQ